MKRTAIKQVAVVFGATVAGVLAFGASAHAAGANADLGKTVAFVRGGAIYVTDGAGETRLTDDDVSSRPRFSPDGKRIAYVHNATVWMMNADGSAQHQVSDRVGGGPAWSPDGASIAFAGLSCTGGPGVYRVAAAAETPSAEVLFPASCREQEVPQMASISSIEEPESGKALAERLRTDAAVAWSPDGTKIAFAGGECEDIADACLSVGTVATGTEHAIDVYGGGGNGDKGFGVVPNWSTDGTKVAWTAYTEDAKPVHIEEADVTGANRRSIGVAEDREMVYASTGKAVLTATVAGRSTITVVDLETGKRTPLRNGSQPTVHP